MPLVDDDELLLLRAMPGSRWDKEARCWRVSTAPQDRGRLLELAQRLGLRVDPELCAASDDQEERGRLLQIGLYPFQVDGALWLRSRPKGLLAHDMGLGKTVQVLSALPANAAAVVVCPATLRGNWRQECERWRPDLVARIVRGRGKFSAPMPGEVVIVNFEILPPAPTKRGAPATIPIPGAHLIVDEASLCKSSKAARSKAVRALARSARSVWLLSGTPMEGKPLDLWGTLRAGDLENEVFDGWGGFLRMFNAYKNKFGGWTFRDPDPQLPERLRRAMHRRTKEEVLPELPKIRRQTVPVETPRKLVVELGKQLGLWQERLSVDELPRFEEISACREQMARAKVQTMLDLVERYEESGVPLIVFSDHRHPIEMLAERSGWRCILSGVGADERTRIVNDFQAGKLSGVGLTIAAGGYGLTLTRSSHIMFVDRSWTPAKNMQAVDRVRRIGQASDSILVIRLEIDHPLERRVSEILDQKEALIRGSIESLVTTPREREKHDHGDVSM